MSDFPVIAVVDDDDAIRDAIADLLQVFNFSCHTFAEAQSFLASYSPGAFDCLITDVRMPGLSGLELQRKLNALGSPIPIIIVTSSTDALTCSRAIEEGAFACLTKPVKDVVLIRHVMAAINRQFPRETDNGQD